MTDQQHPITPPPELAKQWDEECDSGYNPEIDNTFDALKCFASKAAQWGADQELEACCDVLGRWGVHGIDRLRSMRRPKPPSLKKQALEAQQRMWDGGVTRKDWELVRRALETLND